MLESNLTRTWKGDTMDCPECAKPLQKAQPVGNVEIDECHHCKGVWFDQGEIDEIKDKIEPDIRWIDFDLWKKEGEFVPEVNPPKCPKCRQYSLHVLYFDDVNIKIRFCAMCRGVWLRADDFLKIVHVLTEEAEQKSMVEYVRLSLKEAYEMITHPKSLISEWKDLKSVLRLLNYRFFIENPKIREFLLGLQKSLPV
jgi:Zn-finger nucleic acid-binding protein